ncbi:hypothetical protein [Brevibacillus brevis]|nr:hypothetical protein [Brevibacillus brevis]
MGLQVNFFFNSVFDKSAKKQNRFIYFIIFGLLDYLYLVIPASLILSSILSFLVIFSFAQSYTVEFKTKFTFSILYCVLVSLSYFISLYLFYSLDSVDFSFNPINEQDQIANTKAILLGSMIMFAIIQIIRLLAKRRSFSLDNRYYVLFLVIPVVSIYQLSILTYKDVYSFISVIGFLLLNIIIFYIFDNIVDKFQFMHENSQLQHQMDYQDANYEISVDISHGYASGTKIVDKNKAVNVIQIPVANGRDAFDLNFYHKNQKEYVKINGLSYISEDAIPTFNDGKDSLCVIPSDGKARWYKIDAKSANRVMNVETPVSGGFAVYDKNGMTVNFSKASNNHSVVLPESGMIVFGGNAGDVFKIKFD